MSLTAINRGLLIIELEDVVETLLTVLKFIFVVYLLQNNFSLIFSSRVHRSCCVLEIKKMCDNLKIEYLDYVNESNLADIQALVSKDLSEPYSIFTYRYFLQNWPNLCICAYKFSSDVSSASSDASAREMIGTIVCKADLEQDVMRGYIAMLTVNKEYRKQGIGLNLVMIGIKRMIEAGCQEIILETEVSCVVFCCLFVSN